MREPFSFTITDAARFLGKSPVTLRKWEREGIISYPRFDGTGDRRFGVHDLEDLCRTAHRLGRISAQRVKLVEASLTLLELIERENRCSRATRRREE